MVMVDQRKHPRQLLGRQAPGDFQLLTPEAMHPVRVIRDISVSGIRVVVDVAVAKGSDVVLEYSEPTVKLTTQGRVAWCAEQPNESEDAGHFMVGVELFSPFLFMALAGLY